MKAFTKLHVDKIMVAILEDMVFFLHFMCTPMKLLALADFKNQVESKTEEEKEQLAGDIRTHILSTMKQTEPIPSSLPPSLLANINNIYIRHVSKEFGFIGSPDGTTLHTKY